MGLTVGISNNHLDTCLKYSQLSNKIGHVKVNPILKR